MPRGGKFVGKLISPAGGAPEYFGPCESKPEAAQLYSHAAAQLREREAAAAGTRNARALDNGVAKRQPSTGSWFRSALLSPSARPRASAVRAPRVRLWDHRATLFVDVPPAPRAERACAPGALGSPERPAGEEADGSGGAHCYVPPSPPDGASSTATAGAAAAVAVGASASVGAGLGEGAGAGAGEGAGKFKRSARASAGKGARMESRRLYNAVVTVSDLPPAYAEHRFWFVMQFVPDMQW